MDIKHNQHTQLDLLVGTFMITPRCITYTELRGSEGGDVLITLLLKLKPRHWTLEVDGELVGTDSQVLRSNLTLTES